ncbi:MAG: hypothetical protein M9885_13880 [Burkholderiaceae bacterium]|nr:hypothetical protein [Burkholderiaceae bacterium]
MFRNPGFPPLPPPSPARRRLLLGAGALAVLPGCATQSFEAPPAGVTAAVPPSVGQQWRYAEIDLYRGTRRSELTARCIESGTHGIRIALSESDGRTRGDEIWADASRIVQEPSYDITQHFENPVPVLPIPLAAGVSSRTSTRYRTAASPDFPLWWGDWLVAPGWQRVRVPAGEFLALRVDRTIRFRHTDIWREDCRRWDTAWYVPELRRWALREWTGQWLMPDGPQRTLVYEDRVRWELLDFSPGPPRAT